MRVADRVVRGNHAVVDGCCRRSRHVCAVAAPVDSTSTRCENIRSRNLSCEEGMGTRSRDLRGDPKSVVVSDRSPETLASRTRRFAPHSVATAGDAPHPPITRLPSSVPYSHSSISSPSSVVMNLRPISTRRASPLPLLRRRPASIAPGPAIGPFRSLGQLSHQRFILGATGCTCRSAFNFGCLVRRLPLLYECLGQQVDLRALRNVRLYIDATRALGPDLGMILVCGIAVLGLPDVARGGVYRSVRWR